MSKFTRISKFVILIFFEIMIFLRRNVKNILLILTFPLWVIPYLIYLIYYATFYMDDTEETIFVMNPRNCFIPE